MPWLLRQKLSTLYMLAHAALGALYFANQLVLDAALDEELPAEFRHATEMMFYILSFAIVLIAASEND